MEIRSFLAFELPRDIQAIISRVSEAMKRFPIDVRWVKGGNIHLTVVFMGNIHSEDLEGIGEKVKRVCQRYGPFDISLKGVGVFSSIRNPRVLWIGVDGILPRMSYFRDALQKQLKPFGVKSERRPFRPHLTLGRFRKGVRPGADLEALLAPYKELTSPTCLLRDLVLFKSDLTPHGAVYTPMMSWPMAGRH